MTRRSWLLALLGVAVLALSWVALRDRRGVPDGVSEGSIDARVDGPTANAAADASTPSRTLARLDVSAQTAHAAPPRPPAYAQPPVDILVVDAETDAPVEGAEVAFDDGSADARVAAMPVGERGRLAYDGELVARTFGGTTRTGADGVARVGLRTNGGTVHARADGRYGMLRIDAAAEGPPYRHRLVIERDLGFTVRVVDADGGPASGVPVAVGAIGDDGALVETAWVHHPPTTASDGTVTLLHLQRHRLLHSFRQVGTKCVFVALPGLEHVRATFAGSSPPTGIVVLQLPPTGAIAVRQASDGMTEGFHWLSLRLAADVDRDADTVPEWMPERGDDGWTRFPHVPLGRTFALLGFGWLAASPTFAGPTRAGELVRFEWGPRDSEIWLRGRIIDAAGDPVAADITATFDFGFLRGYSEFTPDPEGRFVWCVGTRREGPAGIAKLEFSRCPPGEAPEVAVVAKRSLDATVTDLGDLRLVPMPVVVAGRFVFAAGVRERNIDFLVERYTRAATPDADAQWTAVELRSDQSPDGRFVVSGATVPGRHRLKFSDDDHVPVEPIEFLVGTRGLEIPIDVGRSLTASVLLPLALDSDGEGIHAVLRRASEPLVQHPRDVASMKRTEPGRGVLHWTNLHLGVHSLEIRLHGFATPIVTIPDVNVPPPDDGDPRLRDIDLRERVELLRVRVPAEEPLPWEDSSGSADDLPTGPIVFLLPQDSDREWRGSTEGDDGVDLVIPRGGVDLVIAKFGRQPVTLRGARGSVEIALQRWPEVEIVVEGLDAVPSPFVVVAKSERLSATSGRRWTFQATGGDLDELLLAPAFRHQVENGRMRLPVGERARSWTLWLYDADRDASARIACATPTLAPSAQPLVVRVPPDALARAIAELRADAPVEKDR